MMPDDWESAYRKTGNYPNSTINSGKWLIFVNKTKIEQLWKKIKEATETGKLGAESKVFTFNHKEWIICVYTYDGTDHTDKNHIREELRDMGIINEIRYKTDRETRTRTKTRKIRKLSEFGGKT